MKQPFNANDVPSSKAALILGYVRLARPLGSFLIGLATFLGQVVAREFANFTFLRILRKTGH